MKKRRSNSTPPQPEPDVWINPRRNIRRIDGDRARDNIGNNGSSSGSRFLELADIALGAKKAEPKNKKPTGTAASATDHSAKR